MTLANWVTFSRLLALPVLLYCLQNPTVETRWFSLAIFLVAAATDWLDGYLARKLNSVTELGKFLDPLVDKLLVLAPMLALIELGQVPAWGVFLILARELTVSIAVTSSCLVAVEVVNQLPTAIRRAVSAWRKPPCMRRRRRTPWRPARNGGKPAADHPTIFG